MFRLTVALFTIFALLVQGCADETRAASAELDNKQALRMEACAFDFTPALQASNFDTFSTQSDTASGFSRSYLRHMQEEIGSAIPERPLSANEERVLGVWNLPSGRSTILLSLLNLVISYYDGKGKMPETGADLFPALLTGQGMNELRVADKTLMLDKYADGVSPLTSRFYSSFSASEWQRGAMLIRIVSDPAEIARRMPGAGMPLNPAAAETGARPIEKIVQVTIWGEEPNSILYRGEWIR